MNYRYLVKQKFTIDTRKALFEIGGSSGVKSRVLKIDHQYFYYYYM